MLRPWADIRLQIPFVSDELILKDNFRDGASCQLYFQNDGDFRHVTHICLFFHSSRSQNRIQCILAVKSDSWWQLLILIIFVRLNLPNSHILHRDLTTDGRFIK